MLINCRHAYFLNIMPLWKKHLEFPWPAKLRIRRQTPFRIYHFCLLPCRPADPQRSASVRYSYNCIFTAFDRLIRKHHRRAASKEIFVEMVAPYILRHDATSHAACTGGNLIGVSSCLPNIGSSGCLRKHISEAGQLRWK